MNQTSLPQRPSPLGGVLTFVMALFMMFLFMKLGQIGLVAHWSWWWVYAPVWVSMLAFVVIVIAYAIGLWWAVRKASARFKRGSGR
jgi:membrane protein implicated in regulation of membrane protease activity